VSTFDQDAISLSSKLEHTILLPVNYMFVISPSWSPIMFIREFLTRMSWFTILRSF